MKYLFFVLLIVVSCFTKANITPHSVVLAEKLCKKSPNDCLTKIEPLLKTSSNFGRLYFKLLLMKLEALYALERDKEILATLTPWIDRTDTPLYFQLYVDIYYAKEIAALHKKDQSRYYLAKAKLLLKEINSSFPEPMHLIQLINLQLHFPEEIDSAYENALLLEQKFIARNDAQFNMELYANLGHLAFEKKQLKQQVEYRLKSKYWAEKFGNVQQLGVAYFNLARAYQFVDRLFEAEKQFNLAINQAKTANDIVVVNIAQLHLVEIKLAQKQFPQARSMFAKVDRNILPKSRQEQWQKLKEQLSL